MNPEELKEEFFRLVSHKVAVTLKAMEDLMNRFAQIKTETVRNPTLGQKEITTYVNIDGTFVAKRLDIIPNACQAKGADQNTCGRQSFILDGEERILINPKGVVTVDGMDIKYSFGPLYQFENGQKIFKGYGLIFKDRKTGPVFVDFPQVNTITLGGTPYFIAIDDSGSLHLNHV